MDSRSWRRSRTLRPNSPTNANGQQNQREQFTLCMRSLEITSPSGIFVPMLRQRRIRFEFVVLLAVAVQLVFSTIYSTRAVDLKILPPDTNGWVRVQSTASDPDLVLTILASSNLLSW